MQISIIIPTYNAERHLAATVASVAGQTLTDWELVLVDDGSSDGTVALAQGLAAQDARVRVVRQANGGVANARNRGFAESDPASEYIIFLDHDDLWEPDALQTLARALEDDPEAVAAHGLAYMEDPPTTPGQFRQERISDWKRRKIVKNRVIVCSRDEPTTFSVLVYDGVICTPGIVLIRRWALEKAGPFDQSIAPCDDWDMWTRLSLLGDMVFVDKVLLYWRVHGTNASLNEHRMGQGVSQVRRKMFTLPGMSPEQRELAHARYRRMYSSVERKNAGDCWGWAMRSLRKGRLPVSAGYFAQSLARTARYISLRLFWFDRGDRGPLPTRLKDQARWEKREPV